jgi:hypothetical protein
MAIIKQLFYPINPYNRHKSGLNKVKRDLFLHKFAFSRQNRILKALEH